MVPHPMNLYDCPRPTHLPRPAGDARRRATGEATAAARARPTRALRATSGPRRPALTPRRADSQHSRFPVRRVAARTRPPPRSPAPGRARRSRGAPARTWKPEILGTWQSATRGRFPGSQIASSPTRARSRRPPLRGLRLASRACPNGRCRVRWGTACGSTLGSLWTCFPRAPADRPLHSGAMGAAE